MMAYEESGEDDLIRDPAEVNLEMNVVDSALDFLDGFCQLRFLLISGQELPR